MSKKSNLERSQEEENMVNEEIKFNLKMKANTKPKLISPKATKTAPRKKAPSGKKPAGIGARV